MKKSLNVDIFSHKNNLLTLLSFCMGFSGVIWQLLEDCGPLKSV